MRLKKIWGRTTEKGRTNSWKTWPLWNKGKLLLSKKVQENVSQKKHRYWTDGQNTALSCEITRPMKIHQYWTVNRHTQKTTTRIEGEAAVQLLKKGKSARVDNIPAEPVQASGEDVIIALMTICNKIWQTGEWPTLWTQSLVITFPKKGNLQQCQNYRTISLISHPSKVMRKIILNRLKPHAEKIIAEEQAGFRTGRSNTEQTFNIRILCEKYLQHQKDIYHVLACSFVGNHEEVQHQHKPYRSYQKPL